MAGPVRPQLVLEGAARVEVMLEESERYVLISRFTQDEEGQEQRRYGIVDWKSRTHCELPENVARIERSIFGPSGRRKEKPLFLLPVVLQEPGEGEEPGPQVLTFLDEGCRVHGETEYGPISVARNVLALDADGREVLIYGNGKGLLAMADPWLDERSEITTGFSAFAFVQRTGTLNNPQLLWILENGHLTQRALDGTLVLSLGERVKSFTQLLLTQLRVAYQEGSDVWEAVGPDFEPTRVAQGTCEFAYRSNSFLELQQARTDCTGSTDPNCNPCSEYKLVRNNLMTGETITFDDGVYDAYVDSGFSFENQREKRPDGSQVEHQWIALPGDKIESKFEILPPFAGRPLVLDTAHLVGLKDVGEGEERRRTMVVSRFERSESGIKQIDVDLFEQEQLRVESFLMVPDYRTSSFWWLVFHDKVATGDGALGSLSLMSALDRVVRPVAEDVPVSALPNAPSVRGYSVEVLPTFTKERAIAYIDGAVPLVHDPRGLRGTLHVRLMSGTLGSTIASDVTSYHLLSAPLPGVLYGVEEGDQQGLWFAAL